MMIGESEGEEIGPKSQTFEISMGRLELSHAGRRTQCKMQNQDCLIVFNGYADPAFITFAYYCCDMPLFLNRNDVENP